MRRTIAIAVTLVAVLGASVVASTASAANRMWVGFHDDPSFRWANDRTERIQASARVGPSVIRLLVHWNQVAPTRPTQPADPFDPAYKFDDVDEFVRNAQQRGIEVLITLWGSPTWANGGQTPKFMPRNVNDFQSFARVRKRRA